MHRPIKSSSSRRMSGSSTCSSCSSCSSCSNIISSALNLSLSCHIDASPTSHGHVTATTNNSATTTTSQTHLPLEAMVTLLILAIATTSCYHTTITTSSCHGYAPTSHAYDTTAFTNNENMVMLYSY